MTAMLTGDAAAQVDMPQYDVEKEQEAYRILQQAVEKDMKNPQLHFQLVHVLLALDTYYNNDENDDMEPISADSPADYATIYLSRHPYLKKAIEELHVLEELVPKESPIFSLLGQIYHQKLLNTKIALKYYNMAIDLDPKEYNALKVSAIMGIFMMNVDYRVKICTYCIC